VTNSQKRTICNFQAKPTRSGDRSTAYRTVDCFDQLITSPFPDCTTLDELFERAVRMYNLSPCLGTRDVLEEEDEVQPNGKVFKKVMTLNS